MIDCSKNGTIASVIVVRCRGLEAGYRKVYAQQANSTSPFQISDQIAARWRAPTPIDDLPRAVRHTPKRTAVRISALLFALCSIAAGSSACTRTYDGSMVPTYVAESEPGSLVPKIKFLRTQVEPPNRLLKFPPVPAPPEGTQQEGEPAYKPRRSGRKFLAQAKSLPRKVHCVNGTTDEARIRLLCL